MTDTRQSRYYAQFADIIHRPDDKLLQNWTIDGWQRKKLDDQARVLADLRVTFGNAPDRFIQALIDTETRAFDHIARKMKRSYVPDVSRYKPTIIVHGWAKKRLDILIEQRARFSTFAYWRDPEPQPRNSLNSIMTGLNNQIKKYELHTMEGWESPIDNLAEYVTDLEAMQVFLASARMYNTQCFANRPTMQAMRSLQHLHNTILEKVLDRAWAVPIRPWVHAMSVEELEFSLITMEEFLSHEPEWWDRKDSGVPRIKDDPDIIAASMAGDLEDLSNKRRDHLDHLLLKYRGKANVHVCNFVRKERTIWGKTQMAIAQLKRWGAWYGDAAHPDKVPE